MYLLLLLLHLLYTTTYSYSVSNIVLSIVTYYYYINGAPPLPPYSCIRSFTKLCTCLINFKLCVFLLKKNTTVVVYDTKLAFISINFK